jgi:tetratricopeptide (TPR) repeat protein
MLSNNWDDYFNRGRAFLNKGDNDIAIAYFTEAIKLNPEDDKAYCNRGAAYFSERKYDKAIADLTKVIELNPEDGEAYYSRGAAYALYRKYDNAIADLDKAIELNPNDYHAMAGMGRVYQAKGDKEKARYLYNKVLENKDKLSANSTFILFAQEWLKELDGN